MHSIRPKGGIAVCGYNCSCGCDCYIVVNGVKVAVCDGYEEDGDEK